MVDSDAAFVASVAGVSEFDDHSAASANALSGDRIPLYRQVSSYGQAFAWGAGLGCIRPPRSTCTSVTLAQLIGRFLPRLDTRLGLRTRAPTCSHGETGRPWQ